MTTAHPIELKRGLRDVYLDKTDSSYIDGTIGKLLYRGYDIHELAERSTFEEVVYLLLYGRLPTRRQLDELRAYLAESWRLPPAVQRIIELTKTGHPMEVLRTAVSALAAIDPEVNNNTPEATIRKGLRLTSQALTIVTTHQRMRTGKEPVDRDPGLGHAGNFLYMFSGRRPDPEDVRTMDIDFIVHAEHGSNASSFAARVAASTGADLHSAIVSAIGTLKGPQHGGAAEAVMKMALEIGDPANAQEYARKLLDSGGRVMGFGHRVYHSHDPRAAHLRERSKDLSERMGDPRWFQILEKLEEVMQPYQRRGIYPNVDFFAGSVYHLLGIPEDLFVPIFALGRIPGWTLQVLEQYANNILIRPLLHYVGPMDLKYVPIEERES